MPRFGPASDLIFEILDWRVMGREWDWNEDAGRNPVMNHGAKVGQSLRDEERATIENTSR
jgi:hypothetical protein